MQDVTIITGGAGFIGCKLSKILGPRGDHVVAVDNMHPQIHRSPERPVDLSSEVELVVADIRDASFWDKFLISYRPKAVIHLAAETGTAQSLSLSTRHASVNVVGTTEMLDAFTRANVTPEHLILASSRAVYGEGAWQSAGGEAFYPPMRSHAQLEKQLWDFERDGKPARPLPHLAGKVFPNPSSIYGATKLAQEHVISAWGAAMKVPTSILRFQNVYGPGQSPFNPYTGIINLFHRVAYNGGTIDIYEDGIIGRDFVFIDDVANNVVAALDNPPQSSRTLDVGTGKVTTILEAATHIAALHKAPAPVISGKFRDGDVRWAVSDMTDTKSQLGVGTQVDFIDSGARLVGEWLLSKGFMS